MPQRSVATNFTFEQQRQEINLLAADFWTQKGIVDTAASTYLKHDGSNDFTGQTLAVPNAFTINANSGSGTVTISGNLDVTGTTTTVSSANLEVTDKNILIAKGSTSDAQADGAGITIDSATDITFNFVDNKDALVSSIGLEGTTFVKAPYGQFTGSGTSSTGQGVEINAPDANTGQIISYDRANTAYKELRVKGSSVGVYAGTSNSLVGSFSNTGLSVTGTITASDDITITGANKSFTSESSSTGDYVRMYAGSGTGKWDIYGNGANLRFSDNDSAGSVVFDRNVDANGGLDTTNINATGDINLVNTGSVYGGSGAANVLKLTSTSGNVNHSRIEVGTSEASDNGGIHFYTAGSTNATRRVTIKGTSGNVGIGSDSPTRLLHVEGSSGDDIATFINTDTTDGYGFNIKGGGTASGRYSLRVANAANTEVFKVKADGFAELRGGADVRLTLGNAGTAGTNDSNWIRGVNNNLFYNAATSDHLWEIGGAEHMRLNNSGNLFLRSESANYVVMGSNGDATSNNVTNNMNWIRGNAANVQYNTSGGYHAWEISGAEKMQLTSDGYLTNVAQAGFAARMTANLSHPGNNSFNSGNAWVMPFDDEIWDVGGNFNVSNYTFTAPVTGRYLCCYTVQIEQISNWLWMYIYPVVTGTGGNTNGVASNNAGIVFSDMAGTGVSGNNTTTAEYQTFSNTLVMNLTAGQEVRMGTRGQLSGTIKGLTETQWTMQLLA